MLMSERKALCSVNRAFFQWSLRALYASRGSARAGLTVKSLHLGLIPVIALDTQNLCIPVLIRRAANLDLLQDGKGRRPNENWGKSLWMKYQSIDGTRSDAARSPPKQTVWKRST